MYAFFVGHVHDDELVTEAGDSEWESRTGVELACDVCDLGEK